MDLPRISVVGSTYQGEESIGDFFEEASAAVRALDVGYEIVLVDDGSSDGTYHKLCELQRRDPEHLRVFRLSRNFGHHAAVSAALELTRGELVFLLDTDLQDDPALLPQLLEELQERSVDVVFGYQSTRAGSLLERLGGALFWWLFSRLSGLRIQPNQVTTRLMTRRYVDALLRLGETHRFTAGMMQWIGFPQHAVAVQRRRRQAGKSSYNLGRKIELLLTAITSFSSYPLVLAVRLGFLMTTSGLGYAGYIVVRKILFPGTIAQGWSSVMAAILAVGGVNLCVIGAAGIYLARIYEQVKHRPNYLVMESLEAGTVPTQPATEPSGQPQ